MAYNGERARTIVNVPILPLPDSAREDPTVWLVAHGAIGGAAGQRTKSMLPAALAGFSTHYILDRIPHWDYDRKTSARFWVAPDLAAGIGLAALLASRKTRRTALVGAAFGILPDLELGLRHLGIRRFGVRYPSHGPGARHGQATAIPGTLSQIVTVTAAAWLLRRR